MGSDVEHGCRASSWKGRRKTVREFCRWSVIFPFIQFSCSAIPVQTISRLFQCGGRRGHIPGAIIYSKDFQFLAAGLSVITGCLLDLHMHTCNSCEHRVSCYRQFSEIWIKFSLLHNVTVSKSECDLLHIVL
jgi:hypothetical protein